MNFEIKGWFPPIKFTSVIDGKTYAVCGSNWIEIDANMSYEEILKGWICTAKEIPLIKSYKKATKTQLHQKTIKNETATDPSVFIRNLLEKRRARQAKQDKQPSLFSQA
jgi:hypothetical protein